MQDELSAAVLSEPWGERDKYTDWMKMTFKLDLEEGKDYYLIAFGLWRKLTTKFTGAPEIIFQITEKADPSQNALGAEYPNEKYPEKKPQVVKFIDSQVPREEREVGVLVSLDMPLRKFCMHINTLFQISGGM